MAKAKKKTKVAKSKPKAKPKAKKSTAKKVKAKVKAKAPKAKPKAKTTAKKTTAKKVTAKAAPKAKAPKAKAPKAPKVVAKAPKAAKLPKAAKPEAPKAKTAKVVKGKAAGTQPKVGATAPGFTLPSTGGGSIDLASFRGDKNVVLYFYPKDDTPGCTKQACTFQANLADYDALDTVILGISADGLKSHDKFRSKYGLAFDLVSDESNEVAQKYGVWVEKNMYGNVSMGIQRATFLIAKDGKIAASWPKVSVDGHHDDVLEAVRQLEGGDASEAEDEPVVSEKPAKAAPVSQKARTRGMTGAAIYGARDQGRNDAQDDEGDDRGGASGGGDDFDDDPSDDDDGPYQPGGRDDEDDDLQ